MRDLTEKYIAIQTEFPNKAGELRRILEVQKRYMERVMRQQTTDETKGLLVTVAEGYEVGVELLDYMHKLCQGVANDAVALSEGSEVRNINKMQGQEIRRLWELMEKNGLK